MKRLLTTSLFALLFLVTQAQSSLTLSVDMSQYAGSFTTVGVSGNFNDWSGDANPMTDMGNGIWGITLDVADGTYEYKFQLDAWTTDQDMFQEGDPCTVTDESGMFTNRVIEVLGATTVPTVCFNSCDVCMEAVEGNVTVQVDMNQYEGMFTTVFISGAFNEWAGNGNPLADDDGDGVWTGTVLMPAGANEYKFQVDEWTDQEQFTEGDPCTVTDESGEFTNRVVNVNGDATLDAVCFNSCSACMNLVEGNVTVQVDMNQYSGTFTTVFISGSFNEWAADANPLSDDDGDGVWTATILLPAGPNEYKFQVDAWADQEFFTEGDPCTVTDDSGEFTNRIVNVNGDATLDVVCFGSCSICPGEGGCIVIEEFENEGGDTLTFQYFGSTLDGSSTMVIANPNPSGINTSGSVTEFIKPANSEVWAGAFGDPFTAISVPAGEQVCIKVHYPATGNLALKLESSTTGGDNWIQQLPVDAANEWVELCFDTNLPSLEDPLTPAAGNTYSRLVLFTDFGSNFEEDMIYYLDDIEVCGAGEAEPVDVTFQVDMSDFDGAFTGVFVRGSFNGWGEDNPMTDMGDGNYSTTLSIAPGAHEYKFYAAGVDEWEEFGEFEECVLTTDGFTNRVVAVTASTTLDNVCFNSCYACGESVDIEINVGTSEIEVALDGIFLAGGAEFGAPGRYGLTDPDGDGVYSIKFSRQAGFNSFYTFTNGACADFSCKENIAGQDCANPDNFNDRLMDASTDLVVNTCFGECTTTTECMGSGLADGNITFTVNMSEYMDAFTAVFLSGTFNEWSADANPLTDMGNGIWSTTILVPGGNHEFKFQLDNFAQQEEFAGGEDCTITDASGQFINRALTVDGDADLGEVCYNACTACMVNTNNLTVDNQMFSVIPTLVENSAFIQFNASATASDKVLSVYNAIGELMMTTNLDSFQSEYNLDTSDFANGVYFINVNTQEKLGTQRIIVTK